MRVDPAHLIEQLPDAVVVVDREGCILVANRRAAALTGYTVEELLHLRLEELIPARVRSEHERHRAEYRRAAVVRPMGTGLDLKLLRRDGREVPVDISLGPVEGDLGPLVVATVRDVSDRRRLEEDLHQRASLVELAHDAILVRRLADGVVTLWNQGAVAMYGFSRREALGQVTHELLATEFPISPATITGQLEAEGRWEGELVHTRKDGSRLRVDSRMVVLRPPGGGSPSVLEFNRDVTDERRAHDRLLAEFAVTQAVQSGAGLDEVLGLVADQLLPLAGASSACVAVAVAEGERIEIRAARGQGVSGLQGRIFPTGETYMGAVIVSGVPRILDEATLREHPSRVSSLVPPGPAAIVPLVAEGGSIAAMGVARPSGAGCFTDREVRTLQLFGRVAGIAIQNARYAARAARMMLTDDRERIARTLQQDLSRRLFAVSLALQSTASAAADEVVVNRLMQAVEELDGILSSVRFTVFDLEREQPADDRAEAAGHEDAAPRRHA